jgi:hypothetical protein
MAEIELTPKAGSLNSLRHVDQEKLYDPMFSIRDARTKTETRESPDLYNRILIEEAIAECRVKVGFRATGPQGRQGTRYVAHGCGTQRALASDVEV